MTESDQNIFDQVGNVKDGQPTFEQIVTYVTLKKGYAKQHSEPYNVRTDQTLLEWSKKTKFTLTTITNFFVTSLVFDKGVCTETTHKKRSRSKFFPKKYKRGN